MNVVTETLRLKVGTSQEAFDAVVRHLATMKHPAKRDAHTCMYVTEQGERCAIGGLIKADDETLREWERRSVAGDVESVVFNDQLDIGNISLDLLMSLQRAHDGEFNWTARGYFNWDFLRDVGFRFGLNTSVVDEVTS